MPPGISPINTDINKLISPDLDWRKRDNQFEQAFDREKLILAVVEAPTPELASAASKALSAKLVGRHQRISNRCSRSVPASSSKRTGCCSCRWKRSARSPASSKPPRP